jgi:hypothetical protein
VSASPALTPQFWTPDDIRAALLTDFQARGVSAAVEVGEWDPELRRGEPRVIIGYGRGRVGEPAGHYQPGAVWAVPTMPGQAPASPPQVARAMLDSSQRYSFLIHAPSAGTAEGQAVAARRATDFLLRNTLAALRRALAAPFREAVDVEWPKDDDPRFKGYAGFVHGSVAIFEIVFASPILDDSKILGTVGSMTGTSSVGFPDGTTTPTEPVN